MKKFLLQKVKFDIRAILTPSFVFILLITLMAAAFYFFLKMNPDIIRRLEDYAEVQAAIEDAQESKIQQMLADHRRPY